MSNYVNFCNFHLRITCDYETVSFWILLLNSTHTVLHWTKGRVLLNCRAGQASLHSLPCCRLRSLIDQGSKLHDSMNFFLHNYLLLRDKRHEHDDKEARESTNCIKGSLTRASRLY